MLKIILMQAHIARDNRTMSYIKVRHRCTGFKE